MCMIGTCAEEGDRAPWPGSLAYRVALPGTVPSAQRLAPHAVPLMPGPSPRSDQQPQRERAAAPPDRARPTDHSSGSTMSSSFVPVPLPLDRGLSGVGSNNNNKTRRSQRASSLGSVSSCSSSSSATRGNREDREGGGTGGGGGGGAGVQHRSRCLERGSRSRTPPPLLGSGTRLNGALEASAEQPDCPGPPPGVPGGQEYEDRPITPTVLGYEVMEERAKFTVYKVLVKKTQEESWVVFRRYTDFSRLNDKLKEMFPGFRLALPPKRWFKDNYESIFLEDRQLGLQAFLQNLVAHKDIANSLAVREFLCLDDPPGPFDSLEESRAFCETLEESNYRLQKEVLEKQKEIVSLRRRLEERERMVQLLERRVNGECVSPESPRGLSAQGSESSADIDVESSITEADQDMPEENGCERYLDTTSIVYSGRCEVRPLLSSACWCGPSLGSSPPVIQVTQIHHQQPEP